MVGLKLDPHEVPSPLINKPAPLFEQKLMTDSNQTFSVEKMRGQVWLLNVWASWCTACRQEHPLLMKMSQAIGVPLVGLDYKDTDTEGMSVLTQFGNPYSMLIADIEGRIGIDYGVYGVPETYIIDKAGIIRYKHTGPITEEVLFNTFMPLIKGLDNEKIFYSDCLHSNDSDQC
jgi:cytochrome c biogenesis protein CcmG/thiol:disulfide interchange protein DsbE